MEITKPGVYLDIPEDRYHADSLLAVPSLSCSVAHAIFARSPEHGMDKHPRLSSPETTDSDTLNFGGAVHAELLGVGKKFEIIDASDYRTAAAKEARCRARDTGLIPLLVKQYEKVVRVAEVVRRRIDSDPEMAGVLDDADEIESTVIACDDGAWLRARPDLVARSAMWDLKITGEAAVPEAWARRTANNLGYCFRAAFYQHVRELATGEGMAYRFIVAEADRPHAVSLFEATPRKLELAKVEVKHAIALWRQCLGSGVWPSYPQGINWIDASVGDEFRHEERMARADLDHRAIAVAIEMHRPFFGVQE